MSKKETVGFNPQLAWENQQGTSTDTEFNPEEQWKKQGGGEQVTSVYNPAKEQFGFADLDKVRDILKPVKATDSEKEYVVNMAAKGASHDEISNAILTIQGQHPSQNKELSTGQKLFEGAADYLKLGVAPANLLVEKAIDLKNPASYYLEDTGKGYKVPKPLGYGEKAPNGTEINSVWGTPEEAEDNNRLKHTLKMAANILPHVKESQNELSQLVYGVVTGEESPWYQALKNENKRLEAKTATKYQEGIGLDVSKVKDYNDIFNADNWDLSPSKIANTMTNLGQFWGEVILTRGMLGSAGKGVKGYEALVNTGKLTGKAAEKALKAEEGVKALASSFLTNLPENLNQMSEAGIKGRGAFALTGVATLGQSLIDAFTGGGGAINKAFQKATGKSLIGSLVKGAEHDFANATTKEAKDAVLQDLYKAATTAAETVAKKEPGLLRNVAEEVIGEPTQDMILKASQVLHDKMVSDTDTKYGTELFSPQSVAEEVNAGIQAALGGAQGHIFGKAIKKKEQDDEKSKTIMGAVSSGNANELKTQLIAANKSGEISKEDLDKGLFRIDTYQKYYEATKDRPLDEESKRKIFDLTYEKSNVNAGIEHLEKTNVDGINDGEIDLKKQHVKEIEKAVEDVWKGAEEKEEKSKEPITKANKGFKFTEPEGAPVPIFNAAKMTPEEFNDLDSEDKFHAMWQVTTSVDNKGGLKTHGIVGKLEIPNNGAAFVNIGGKTIELATSDQNKVVERDGEDFYPNRVLQQFDNETVRIRPIDAQGKQGLAIFDNEGNRLHDADGKPYFIRQSLEGKSRSKYNSEAFIHPEHLETHKKGHEGLIIVPDFETRNLGSEFEGEAQSPEANEILKKSIRNPHESWKYGEKYIDFAHRTIEAYKTWLNKAKDKSLIVTHSQNIALINQWEKQGRPDNLNELDFDALAEAKVYPEEIAEHNSAKGKIYLVRTAPTTEAQDEVKKFKARHGVELSEEGKVTAVKMGQALKGLGISDIVTSSQTRAKETAKIIKSTIDGKPLGETKTKPPVKPKGGGMGEETKATKAVRKEGAEKEAKPDKEVAEKGEENLENVVKNINLAEENGKEGTEGIEPKTGGVGETVLPKGIEEGKTKKAPRLYLGNTLSKERRKIKSPLHIKALALEVFTPFDLALQYFIKKGNVSPKTISDLYKGSHQELKHRISLVKKGAPNSEGIGHDLWENNGQLGFDSHDYRNAVEQVLAEFTSRSQMAQDLIVRHTEGTNYTQSEQELIDAIEEAEKTGVEDVLEKAIEEAETLSEEEFKDVATKQDDFDKWEEGTDIFRGEEGPEAFQKPKVKNQSSLWDITTPEFDFTEKPEETKEVVSAGEKTPEVVAEVVKTEVPKGKIEDYGEKIGGAKKDLAKKLSEITTEDIASQPLSKSFPKPDYVKLTEEGIVTQEGAILLKFLYDNIPAKPRVSWKLKTWVSRVQSAIDTCKQLIESERTKDFDFTEELLKRGNNTHFNEMYKNFSEIMKGLGFPKKDVNLGNLTIKKFTKLSEKNNETNERTTSSRYTIVNGHSIVKDFTSMEDAIEGLKAILDDSSSKDKTKETKFNVYQSRKTGDFFIGKKGAKDVITLMSGFKSAKEAFLFLADKKAEIQKIWDGMKINPEERRISNEPRVGVDWRKGKNIDSEEFGKTFGFRGIEFGNWVNDKDRQAHVNEAYDSLMDLASVLNISPKALSLNGQLGLAFGARGGGKASAHYESDKIVINLTKTKGAGSLAHEWWHALDNYFSRKRGLKNEFLTQAPRQFVTREGKPDERIRKEMTEAFKGVMDAIASTELRNRSAQIDATKSKEYWSTAIEMSARSFENFIIEKLGEIKQSNDYLANFKETSEWINDMGLDLGNYPYPLKDESEVINNAFKNLFDTIEEKVGESGNVELFQKPQPSLFGRDEDYIDKLKEEIKFHESQISPKRLNDLKKYASVNELKEIVKGTTDKINELKAKLTDAESDLQKPNQKNILERLKKKFPNLGFYIHEKDDSIELIAMHLKESDRNNGKGSEFVKELKDYANQEGKKIIVKVTNELGGDIVRLNKFYASNGFTKVGENRYEYKPKGKLQEKLTFQTIKEINERLKSKFPKVSSFVTLSNDGNLQLTAIFVKEANRNQGEASRLINELKKEAEVYGKKIYASATIELGGDISKLNKFYIKNGFTKIGENKYEYIPKPTQKVSSQENQSTLVAVQKITNLLKARNPKLKIVYDNTLKAAGAAQGNAIKINPFYAGTDTPIHEVAHILIDSIGGLDNKVIRSAVNEIKNGNIKFLDGKDKKSGKDIYITGQELWEETVKRYSKNGVWELSEEGMDKEVLAEAIGREGSMIFETEAAKSKFRTLLDYIFHRIKSLFGLEKNNVKALAKRVIAGDVYNKSKKTFEEKAQRQEGEYLELINGFYSPIEKTLRDFKLPNQSATKWLNMLGKGDEVTFSGLRAYLESKRPDEQVKKQELVDFIRNNRIQIKEVVKGGDGSDLQNRAEKAEKKFGVNITIDENPMDGSPDIQIGGEKLDDMSEDEIQELQDEVTDYVMAEAPESKFHQYQLEGEKEGYREVLITLPVKEKEKFIDESKIKEVVETKDGEWAVKLHDGTRFIYPDAATAIEAKNQFLKELDKGRIKIAGETLNKDVYRSSHFEEPNIVVHLRMNIRKDSEGNKVLFLEEIQSDYGQSGKKQGFNEKYKPNEVEVLDKNAPEANQPELFWYFKVPGNVLQISKKKYATLQEAKDYVINEKKKVDSGIEAAPYVTDTNSWVKLGLKIALQHAVKEGASKLVWTTGEQQNERYDLSKQVKYIDYEKVDDNEYNLTIRMPDGVDQKEENVDLAHIENLVGKDIANKIKNDEGSDEYSGYSKRLEGEGLKVGGKGMIGFYGSPSEGKTGIIGGVAEKLFGKGSIKTTQIDTGKQTKKTFEQWIKDNFPYKSSRPKPGTTDYENERKTWENTVKSELDTQHSIDITPEMEFEVGKGLPQFQKPKAPKPISPAKQKLIDKATAISEANDLEKYSTEELINFYNQFISSGYWNSTKELKEVGKRIAYVMFRQRKDEIAKTFGKDFSEHEANKSDLKWKDIRVKAFSHMTEAFPELQSVGKFFDAKVADMQEERYKKKSRLERLGKAVIKDTNSRLGFKDKLTAFRNSAKYFDYLDNKGKLITLEEAKQKGLSEAQTEYLKYIRELIAERQDIESNEDIYNKELESLKVGKTAGEAFQTEGVVSALNTYLGGGRLVGDVRIEYKNPLTGKTEIDEFKNVEKNLIEYSKKGPAQKILALVEMIKYNFKARKQFAKKVNADEEVNPLDATTRGEYQINPKGELTSRFDKSYEGDNYSKDFYRAAMEFIDDTTHTKHMGKVLPIMNAIENLNKEGLNEHLEKPNVVRWISEWRKLHLFKETNTTDPYLDSALKFLRFSTSALTFMFNYSAGAINLALGLYNNFRAETDAWRAKGHRRLYGNLKSHNVRKGLGLVNPYAVDILDKYNVVNKDFDSNPKVFAGKLFDMMAYGANRLGEFDIQGAMALGQMKDEDYNSFEYNDKGELVVKPGVDVKALSERMTAIKNRVSDIQGKYSEKDKRSIMNSELGKTALQYKVWIFDYWKERFGEKYITRDNVVHQGSWRVFTGDAIKDLKADIRARGVKAIWENKSAMSNLKGAMVVALLLTLKYSDDDDEKKRRKALSLENALGNLMFIFDVDQLAFTVKQPIASVGTLIKFTNVLQDVLKMDDINTKKLSKDAQKLIPYRKGVQSFEEVFGSE